MATLQQITVEQIARAYQAGKINLDESSAHISAFDALEVFKEIVELLDAKQKSELFYDYLVTGSDSQIDSLLRSAGAISSHIIRLAMLEYVQDQVTEAFDALWDLRDEIEQGRHVDAQITEAREQSL